MPRQTRRGDARAASCGAVLPDRREPFAAARPPSPHAHGFDAVHVQELGLRGASDADILARAIADDRIIVTSNAEDSRRLGARTPAHPGLAIMLDAVGRAQQLTLGVGLANAIHSAGTAHGRLFEIDRQGSVVSPTLKKA
jgi:hypothetical protein